MWGCDRRKERFLRAEFGGRSVFLFFESKVLIVLFLRVVFCAGDKSGDKCWGQVGSFVLTLSVRGPLPKG